MLLSTVDNNLNADAVHRLYNSVMMMKRLQRMLAAASAGVLMRCCLHLAKC
jgi:hypothetical protein